MILRRIGAVILGIVIAVAIVQVIEVAGHHLYPPPPGTDMHDMKAVKAYVAKLPRTAFVLVLAGWFVGTLLGTWIAAKIGRTAVTAYIVGALLLCGGIVNALVIPQPSWFSTVSFVIYIGMTLVGARLGRPAVPSPAG